MQYIVTGIVVLYLVLYVIFEWENWRRRQRRRKEWLDRK